MKIAFVVINANRFEGTSRAVVEVAERLAKRHEIHLVSRTAVDVDLSNIHWHRIAGPAWPDVAEFEVFRQRAERHVKNQEFQIIHAAGCVVLNADVYAIQTVHPKKMEATDSQQRNNGAGLARRFTRWLYDRRVVDAERRAYVSWGKRGTRGFLPVSSGTEKELRSCYPVDDGLVEVVCNGADLDRFSPSLRESSRDLIRSELALGDDRIVALFAGGEWGRKGLKFAIEGLAAAKFSQLCLVVAGSDPQAALYQQLAQQLGVEDQVLWLGFRDDIDRLYAAADIFLFPSAYEAFSLATIEAAASGLPVVMCDISGAAELVGDGRGGRMVERDGAAIGNALVELATDSQLRQRLGNEARVKVEQYFNWDLIAEQTESFYFRLAAAREDANANRRH